MAEKEYIEREAVMHLLCRFCLAVPCKEKPNCAAFNWLNTIPAADVEPVQHGRWIFKAGGNWYGGGGYECSACKYGYAIGAYHEPDEFTYCPNCGAKMDGGE